MCRQGFAHGYKVVNTWLREYLAKPGRNSSEQEKAKRQAYLDAVQAEQGGVFLPEELVLKTPTRGEKVPVEVSPLESPRHLTWLLLRDPNGLTEQEQHMLTFMRQLPAIETIYQLAQRFFMTAEATACR